MPSNKKYEGIVVLGAPRSGATLLRRLINAHPHVHCPPETNLLSAAARFLHEEQTVDGLTVGVIPGLSYSGYSKSEVLSRLREFVFGFFSEMARSSGATLWAEKSTFDVFHLDQIEKLLEDSCRYVCVFRHGLDVVMSMFELFGEMDRYLEEIHRYLRQHSSPSEAFAHSWSDCSERLLRFINEHPDTAIYVRYEDLLADPAANLARIFDFLDEPTSPREVVCRAFGLNMETGLDDWKTYLEESLSAKSVDRWKIMFPHSLARLGPIVNPVLASIGYDTVPIPHLRTAEQAREHYRLWYADEQTACRTLDADIESNS